MSAEAVSYVLENSKAKPIPRLVLVSIANHADENGCYSGVSMSTIMAETGVSYNHIRKCLRALENAGELSTRVNASPTMSNVYTIVGMGGAIRGIGLRGIGIRGSCIKQRKKERAEREPLIRPFSVREMKDKQIWSELHVGTGPLAGRHHG